ncbi:MAG: hypothetical protein IIA64_08890 [Planctomycetes bacterium]|nr:hypothetical protein [Planctomycetota bacterium]
MRAQVNSVWADKAKDFEVDSEPEKQDEGRRDVAPYFYRRQKFEEQWKASRSRFQKSFNLHPSFMAQIMQVMEETTKHMTFPGKLPNEVLSREWQQVMQQSSERLAKLSKAYEKWAKALRDR